jgi:hypothetical protein
MPVKDPLNKLIIETLGKPFFLNVVRFKGDDNWFPCWYTKWAGSEYRMEAVKLRRELYKYLHDKGSDTWKEKNLKTVKISYYQ